MQFPRIRSPRKAHKRSIRNLAGCLFVLCLACVGPRVHYAKSPYSEASPHSTNYQICDDEVVLIEFLIFLLEIATDCRLD